MAHDESISGLDDVLTVIIPTRDRAHLVDPLLRYLRHFGLRTRIVVADSSLSGDLKSNARIAASVSAEHRPYPHEIEFFDKLIDAIETVTTPFTVMLPDDDLPMPEAVRAGTKALLETRDAAVAWGYVLDYFDGGREFDIFRVRWFSPGIDLPSPFARVYELVRRYGPFFWGIFRTNVLADGLREARAAKRNVFQELALVVSTAIYGKVIRLPMVYSLRGKELSLSHRHLVEPLFAVLDDAQAFFDEYVAYRDRLVALSRRVLGPDAEKDLVNCSIEQFFDLVHSIGLARELDGGPINYTVQRILGAPHPPIPIPQVTRMAALPTDVVHASGVPGRRYRWRRAVLDAEPRGEIDISAAEVERVERQLEHYRR
jgi:glycosyltransferase domain-containing protein